MNEIRIGVADIAVTFRANVGMFQAGDRYVSTGLPKGFPDLFGFRKSDAKFIAIEIKTAAGRLRKEQADMLKSLREAGALAGVARSVEEARRLIIDDTEAL